MSAALDVDRVLFLGIRSGAAVASVPPGGVLCVRRCVLKLRLSRCDIMLAVSRQICGDPSSASRFPRFAAAGASFSSGMLEGQEADNAAGMSSAVRQTTPSGCYRARITRERKPYRPIAISSSFPGAELPGTKACAIIWQHDALRAFPSSYDGESVVPRRPLPASERKAVARQMQRPESGEKVSAVTSRRANDDVVGARRPLVTR